jgi:glutamyl-tRNA synthetase
MSKPKQDSGGSFKIDLKDAVEGEVCTRFPPEPSGYLHVGHAKAVLLNDYFAKLYKGKMILRFDDTNPSKENKEFVDNIIRDVDVLGVKYNKITHTSDSFTQILEFATQLLKEGKAYIDDTDRETMQKQKYNKEESKCRNNSVELNLTMWDDMQKGIRKGMTCVMRAKIDMKSGNGTLRDPVLYRCNLTPHHRTGTTYKVYPTYDLACPIVDSLEGVTHALRTTEYIDRDAQYAWVLNALNLRVVHIWSFSRLNFKYNIMSKRKLAWFVEQKLVDGWNDPRFPTIQGMLKRGLTVQSLREFILDQGASKSENVMDWNKLWAFNYKRLNNISSRYTVVNTTPKTVFKLKDVEEDVQKQQLHPKIPEMGFKQVHYSNTILLESDDANLIEEGEEVTLINWGNAIIEKITRNEEAGVILLEGVLNLEGDVKSTKKKLTWIDYYNKLLVKIVEFDHLITEPVIKKDQDFKDFLTPQTKFVTDAYGEIALSELKKGSIIQLMRKGFFICEEEFDIDTPLVLFAIPDGKQTDVSVLSSKVAKKQTIKN